ncbi:MAG: cell division protease FtsH, partial [Solirubrobacteraceae bacterium]|nr:cell division protease FtsH [Solirubrobacteraceae bacterium]
IAGPEKKTRLLSPKEREITAVHEMGHALVGHYLEHNDPVHKISIVGRGMALGYVISLPTEDKFMRSRLELMDALAKNLGGRTAEELVFGEVTTGAEDDLNKTTDTAKRMVMRWGMSEKLGPRTFGRDSSQPFLGRDFGHEQDYSEEIAREIDDEIRRIVEAAHQRAKDLLGEHRQRLETISEILLKRETIEKEEFLALLAGKTEEETFGAADAATPPPDVPGTPAPAERAGREAPRPLPRPGLAGGGVEARGLDLPDKPEIG